MVQGILDAFAADVEARVVAAITDEGAGGPTPQHPASRRSAPKPTARKAAPAVARQAKAEPSVARVPTDDSAYRPRILAALADAPAGLSRTQLIRHLELKPSEEGRLASALVALRASNAVVLEGMRRQAVYRTSAS